MDSKPACCHRTRERTPEEYRSLVQPPQPHRGAGPRHPGHAGEGRLLPGHLAQAAAANAALNAFSRELLAQHIRTCVARDIREGKDEIIDELMDTLRRLMR